MGPPPGALLPSTPGAAACNTCADAEGEFVWECEVLEVFRAVLGVHVEFWWSLGTRGLWGRICIRPPPGALLRDLLAPATPGAAARNTCTDVGGTVFGVELCSFGTHGCGFRSHGASARRSAAFDSRRGRLQHLRRRRRASLSGSARFWRLEAFRKALGL